MSQPREKLNHEEIVSNITAILKAQYFQRAVYSVRMAKSAQRNEIPCGARNITWLNWTLITAHAEHKYRLIKWSRMVKDSSLLRK